MNVDHEFADVAVQTAAGPKTLNTTKHHPFYDATTGLWTDAGDLKVGDWLDTPGDGHVTVVSVRLHDGSNVMYNLTIDSVHTYYVVAGDTPILVHNTCGPIVLGVSEHSDPLASKLKGSTFNDSNFGDLGEGGVPRWMTGVMDVASDPSRELTVTLDGLPGATPEEAFSNAYIRGVKGGMAKATDSGYGTAWEMSVVGRNAYINSLDLGGRPWSSIQFYWNGAPVTVTEPAWADLRAAAGQ